MKKIKEVGLVQSVNATDKLPVSQGGNASVTVSINQLAEFMIDNYAMTNAEVDALFA